MEHFECGKVVRKSRNIWEQRFPPDANILKIFLCLIGCFTRYLTAKSISYTFPKVQALLPPTLHTHRARRTGLWFNSNSNNWMRDPSISSPTPLPLHLWEVFSIWLSIKAHNALYLEVWAWAGGQDVCTAWPDQPFSYHVYVMGINKTSFGKSLGVGWLHSRIKD